MFRLRFPKGHIIIRDLDFEPEQGSVTDINAQLTVELNGLTETTALDLPGVVLGPKVIEVPTIDIRSRPLNLTGRAVIPLDGELDVDLQLSIPLEEINDALVEPRRAHGHASADIRIEGSQQAPVARATVSARQLELDLPGVFTPILHYKLGDLHAAVVADKDGIQLEQLTAKIASGTLTAWGFITPDLQLVDGHVVGDRLSLRQMLMAFDGAPTPWIDMTTDLEVAWSGPLNPPHLQGTFDLNVAELRVGNGPIAKPGVGLMLDIPHAHATGSIELVKDGVLLTSDNVHGPRTHANMVADIGFGPRGPLDLEVDMYRVDMVDFQPLNGVEMSGRGQISGRISGPFNRLSMRGLGDVRDFSVLGIQYADRLVTELVSPDMKSIQMHGAQATKGVTNYGGYYAFDFKPPMQMHTDIVFEPGGRVEDMVGVFIDLPGMQGDMTGTLSLHGDLYDLDGAGHLQLENIDLWGEAFDVGEAHGYMEQGLFTMNDLTVLRNDGREGIVMRGSVKRDWALDMELFGDGLAIERMTRMADSTMPLTGHIGFHSRITNTLFDPSPDGRIYITDVRYNGYPVEDSQLVFNSAGGVAEYGAVLLGGAATADGTLGLWDLQPYALVMELDALPVHLLYPEGANGNPIKATTSGRVNISGHFGETWSPVALRANLNRVEVRYGHHLLTNPGPWVIRQQGKNYQLSNVALQGGATNLSVSAQGGDSLQLGGEGTLDLDLLRAAVPGLTRSVGTAGIKLFATGAPPNVVAGVSLDIDAEIMRHASVPAAFEDMRSVAQISADQIEIASLNGSIGGGTISASGIVASEDWVPKRYDLSARIQDAQIQWVDSLPPAIGDATLQFDGPIDQLLLSGAVSVNDMTFSDRIDWEDWVVEYRNEMLVDPASLYELDASWFDLNITIDAEKTIRLRNNIAEGLATAHLKVIGSTARPGLTGTVNVEDGIAIVQDREFHIDRGDVVFRDPWTWDPDLDFDLVTDLENLDQRYRVNYLVMGPFSDWRTQTRSDPALPQSDVNALLWFGATTDQLEEMGELSSAVAQGVADLVLTDFFLTNAQASELGGAQDVLFDTLDLATGVNARGLYSSDPRLVVGKRLEQLGGVDLSWELNLVRPDDNYVAIERRIGGMWSVAGWYATLQRERVLPIGGAYGADITARWESD
jgi:hypothetical protein